MTLKESHQLMSASLLEMSCWSQEELIRWRYQMIKGEDS
uniref:Uncharacterized protein n=1 Tax=Lotus japonicus TaxID=34305 RepID=I3T9P1_LOTJA|nr:unknown [Lotus japonicus]